MRGEFFREVINSDELGNLILPEELKHKKVEILVLPIEEKKIRNKKSSKSLRGALKKYSSPDKIDKEKEAWKMAVAEKHEDS
jgi:hypothetical protein